MQQAADDAVTGFDGRGPELHGQLAECHDGAVGAAIGFGQEDGAVARGEQFLGVARDAVHHDREIERGREVAPDLGQRL